MAEVRYEDVTYEEDSTGRVVIATEGESDAQWFVSVRDIYVENDFIQNLDGGGEGEELSILRLREGTDISCARCGGEIDGTKGMKVASEAESSFMILCHDEHSSEATCYEKFAESAKEAIEEIEDEIIARQI